MLDGLDHKVRYPEHVTHQMRLSILGAVPRFDWRHLGNGKTAEAAAPVVEALRGLRLRLSHAGGAGPLLVTVTSPGVGEGKSFLSCNLALAFADAGYRTLLIDGDVRRGGQHRMLGLHREPGLVDFLAGDLPFETVVQATRHPGLRFIGCGARRPSAPELLSSDVMTDLIDRVRAECGVVLVDSPPLAVGVDPYVLATRTGNVLIVLRAGVSDLDLAAAKLDVLDTLPVRVLGAVLNDVRPYGAYRYYTYDAAAYAEATAPSAAAAPGRRACCGGAREPRTGPPVARGDAVGTRVAGPGAARRGSGGPGAARGPPLPLAARADDGPPARVPVRAAGFSAAHRRRGRYAPRRGDPRPIDGRGLSAR